MSIVFDLLGAQNRDHGERGIARLVVELALAVERLAPGLVDTYLTRSHLPVPGALEPLVATGRVRHLDRDRRRDPPGDGGTYLAGSLFELVEPFDQVLPRRFRTPAWRRTAVLYDFVPCRYPDLYLREPLIRRPYEAGLAAARTLDHGFAISQATAADATELLSIDPSRLTVIGAGTAPRFSPHPGGRSGALDELTASPPVDGLRPGFVLCPTGIDPRKNVERTLVAYASLPPELRRRHQLLLAARANPDEAAGIAASADALGIGADVLLTGRVLDDDELVLLYRAAHVVAFTSLYEGFGLPVLEAMRCGAAVVCSDSSSLTEVQVDPTARFDPEDVDAIGGTLRRVLQDELELDRLRGQPAPPWTWDRAAQAVVAELDRGRPAASPRRRPRLAVVTPLPPQESGIARYGARLLPRLVGVVDVTAFVETDPVGVGPVDGVDVQHVASFDGIDGGGGWFDRVLFLLGNSEFHVESLDLLRRTGGTVVLHDGRLTGLYGEVQRRHPERLAGGRVGSVVEALYPGRYRAEVIGAEVIDPELADRAGVHLLREVVDAADDLLVHSRHAAALVELDTGVAVHVPFALPCPPVDPVPATTDPPPVIVSLGLVSPVKDPELVIDAVACVPEAPQLRFVGPVASTLRDRLLAHAADVGVDVVVTGALDDTDYRAEIHGAACAVQLRRSSHGESSAGVCDALAAGLPTVTTAIGALRELPAEAVVFVPPDVGPVELARELATLLTDPHARSRVRDAALGHARRNQHERAADVLLARLGLPAPTSG